MDKTANRNYPFDLARSICVVWIVGFWHLLNYLPSEYQLSDNALPICKGITVSVLACFTFLSGFFLKKYEFGSIKDTIQFYKKRFWRFYPLFVVAAFSLLLCGSSLKQVLLAIVGLSMFLPPPIQTLWYFSMLILFYLMTPLLQFKTGRRLSLTLCVALLVLVLSCFYADARLVLYFPFYVLGLNVSNKIVEKSLSGYAIFVALPVYIVMLCAEIDNYFYQFIQTLVGVVVILSISKSLYSPKIQSPISIIAEASMCAYLFHRPFYSLIVIALKKLTSLQAMPLLLAVLSVVLLFVFAYYTQKVYNHYIIKIQNNG